VHAGGGGTWHGRAAVFHVASLKPGK
jgi:hypothetical protein